MSQTMWDLNMNDGFSANESVDEIGATNGFDSWLLLVLLVTWKQGV